MNLLLLIAAVVVGTWNGDWFPSGRAEHRAPAAVEDRRIGEAAKLLRQGIDAADPSGNAAVVLVLNEMRGPREASNLVARIGRPGLRMVAISSYRRRDRFDQQQDVIATTLPVVAAGWHRWSKAGKETPPRGYVCATLVVEPAITARVCAVHLKSNYGATTPEIAALNRAKRTRAITNLMAWQRGDRVIIAGDFNADRWKREFADEPMFALLDKAGFTDLLSLLPDGSRGTYKNRKMGDSALDNIYLRGFRPIGVPRIEPTRRKLSDHCPVFCIVET